MSETDEARMIRYVEALPDEWSASTYEDAARAVIAVANEEQAALRAEVERLTVLTDLDANRIQEIEARALDYYSRAETAEAEVERLTRECLDREATEIDARERLRRCETTGDIPMLPPGLEATIEAGIADGTIFAGEQSRAEAAEARVRRYAESVGWAKLLEELERLHSVEVKLADARERLRRCEERLAIAQAIAKTATDALPSPTFAQDERWNDGLDGQ